jgi:hypothetical protein
MSYGGGAAALAPGALRHDAMPIAISESRKREFDSRDVKV